jgi:hypothetical protein
MRRAEDSMVDGARYTVIAAFILNLPWEFAQMPLFKQHGGGGGGSIAFCLAAAIADALIAVAVVRIAFATARRSPLSMHDRAPYVLSALFGAIAAALFEGLGIALHLWAYSARMPIVFGIGAVPLVQLTLLIPLSLYLSRRLALDRV